LTATMLSDGMPINYVSDSITLSRLCAKWQQEPCLAIDTEFERTNTFYARLGLLQIADRDACYIIDPLQIEDWQAFVELLTNPDCMLVLHSCSEDLNLIQTFFDCLPVSIFDTQIAAAFLDIGFSTSYQSLVEILLGIEVAKDETRSDWIKRPLSDKQVLYAATDVRYLLQIRELLDNQIEQKGMSAWFRAECEQQLIVAKAVEDYSQWQNLYAGISNAWRLNKTGLQALRLLCVWREQKARQRNKPRSWIVKDNDLLNLCSVTGRFLCEGVLTMDMLINAEGVDQRFLQRNARELLTLLTEQTNMQEVDFSLLKKPLSAPLRKKLKNCQQVAKEKAKELEISPELLGRKRHLLELVRSVERNGQLQWLGELSGWRRQLLEPEISKVFSATD